MAKTVNYQDILSTILKIWIVCFGAITFQVVIGYYVSHVLLPYIGFGLITALLIFENNNMKHSTTCCSLVTHYTIYALAVSGVIMLVANLLNTNLITNKYSEFSHHNYPFHAAFIVYPVTAVMFGVALLRRGKPSYCKACRTASEFSLSESLRRNVLHHESKSQLYMAFFISLALAVVVYVYYFLVYRSGASSRKYSPDIFFLYILPAVVYVISIIYAISRYFSLEFEISLKAPQDDSVRSSRVRYMIICEDKLLLKDVIGDGLSSMWDTPADLAVSSFKSIPMWEAEKAFARFYGSDKFRLKRLFVTNKDAHNVLHCAAFLDLIDGAEPTSIEGEWFTLRDVDMMLSIGVISRPFAIELHRVFTITMAWKTYDRSGKRLYPIKNYRPSFRLRDFKDWDVDYEDLNWISISENNQDKPFYGLRRFWRTYISGTDKRWQQKKNS